MSNFGKRVDGPNGRRRSAREAVVLAGSAVAPGSSRSVVVTDVSPTGAKLQGRELPKTGADVMLTVGESEIFATIVWSSFDEAGITFDEQLSNDVVAHLKLEGHWGKVMGVEASA